VRVWFLEEKMSGKGAKGLLTSKTPAQSKDKDKKKPTSRSSRAGLQVFSGFLSLCSCFNLNYGFLIIK
jgi:hypothetical protein